jgi:predicted dinucleotide-binding enzyme
MRIAVLGAGRIGSTLGKKWAAAGHEIVFGVRDPEGRPVALGAEQGLDQLMVESLGSAVTSGQVIVLAVPGLAVAEIMKQHGQAMAGKIVIDATNNIRAATMHALDAIRAGAPDALVFRAFNSLGWENFAQPVLGGIQADLFYCGTESPDAQAVVEGLIEAVGLRPVRVGGLEQIDIVEGVTRLWFAMIRQKGRHLAFKMLEGD